MTSFRLSHPRGAAGGQITVRDGMVNFDPLVLYRIRCGRWDLRRAGLNQASIASQAFPEAPRPAPKRDPTTLGPAYKSDRVAR